MQDRLKKLEWPEKNFDAIFSCFDAIHECERWMDKRLDR